jgi:hypothetical protein
MLYYWCKFFFNGFISLETPLDVIYKEWLEKLQTDLTFAIFQVYQENKVEIIRYPLKHSLTHKLYQICCKVYFTN